MARRKKQEEELSQVEPTENDENPEIEEAVQAEFEASEETSEESDEAIEAEVAPEEAPKKPRKRRQRRKKAAEPTLLQTKPLDDTTEEEASATETNFPAPSPTTAPAPEVPHIREDAAVAEVSIHKSMDSMVKQWAAVKDISTSVCTNLERVASFLKELETNYATASQELAKRENSKNRLVTRVAVGSSAVALVLSLISLSLSQSTRQAALGAFAKRPASEAVTTAHAAVAPSQPTSNELATNTPTHPVSRPNAERRTRIPFKGASAPRNKR